jgi:hypothetical protein
MYGERSPIWDSARGVFFGLSLATKADLVRHHGGLATEPAQCRQLKLGYARPRLASAAARALWNQIKRRAQPPVALPGGLGADGRYHCRRGRRQDCNASIEDTVADGQPGDVHRNQTTWRATNFYRVTRSIPLRQPFRPGRGGRMSEQMNAQVDAALFAGKRVR